MNTYLVTYITMPSMACYVLLCASSIPVDCPHGLIDLEIAQIVHFLNNILWLERRNMTVRLINKHRKESERWLFSLKGILYHTVCRNQPDQIFIRLQSCRSNGVGIDMDRLRDQSVSPGVTFKFLIPIFGWLECLRRLNWNISRGTRTPEDPS